MACMTCPRCHNSRPNFIDKCTICGCSQLVFDDQGLEDYEGEIDTKPIIQQISTKKNRDTFEE